MSDVNMFSSGLFYLISKQIVYFIFKILFNQLSMLLLIVNKKMEMVVGNFM